MIPKVIHYCWFGDGAMNPLHQRCMESWKEFCPEYEIKLWNESNSDIDNAYCREAIRQRKWAFVSDWVRIDKLYRHGGIYLDTDIELIRSLDEIAAMDKFVVAREAINVVGSAFLASTAGSPVLQTAREMMLEYLPAKRLFTSSPVIVTHAIERNDPAETTVLKNETFFPFNPYDHGKVPNRRQLMYCDITEDTIGIHHYGPSASWANYRFRRNLLKLLHAVGWRRDWKISMTPFGENGR